MMHLITSITDRLISFIKDDPVRPDIPAEFRVEKNRFIATLVEEDQPSAMVCISLHDFVPSSIEELHMTSEEPDTAVFYTIWSYKSGQGAKLLQAALPEIRERYPTIQRFVTLSPKTNVARRFHLKNGAIILRENEDTTNYEYIVKNEHHV